VGGHPRCGAADTEDAVGSIQIIGMPDENSAVVKKLSITVRETRAALVVNLFNEPTGKWEPAASTGVPLSK
jgi:hypothetical protein